MSATNSSMVVLRSTIYALPYSYTSKVSFAKFVISECVGIDVFIYNIIYTIIYNI